MLNSGSGAVTPFRYNGQYYDEESGLIYLRNRYYDPTTGRFTQEDPAKDGLNWYVYCGNEPVNMVDPWGLENVMIKYIVEAIGGSVIGFDSYNNTVTIEYNNNIVTHKYDRVVNIQDDNGDIVPRAITDSGMLYYDLKQCGFTGSSGDLVHLPGDRFNSMNEAAYAWALTYNGECVEGTNIDGERGYERGSNIYRLGNGYLFIRKSNGRLCLKSYLFSKYT